MLHTRYTPTIVLILILIIIALTPTCRLAAVGPIQQPGEPPPASTVPNPPPTSEPRAELPGAVAVIIDDHADARPQSGLAVADLVYEIIAEGGITRFLAFFYSRNPGDIGPVRSARPYFLQIVRAYQVPLFHCGGSTEALELIPRLGIKSVNELTADRVYFYRAKGRQMPHNLSTSGELIARATQRKGWVVALPTLPQGQAEGGRPVAGVSLEYRAFGWQAVRIDWSLADGRYQRNLNGAVARDAQGREIVADNVIILEVPSRSVTVDGILLSEVDIIGHGRAWFFSRGRLYEGTWEKSSAESHFHYRVGETEMKFAPGVTWVQVVPDLDKLDVKENS
ncbi:MAG: DUF3048 domain-containing protein [Bacillota bacterium]